MKCPIFKFAGGKQYEPSAFAKATAGQERKGALSLGPLDFSVLLERSGARGNSLRSNSPRATDLSAMLDLVTTGLKKKSSGILCHYMPPSGGFLRPPALQAETHLQA
jgi:hypothetical protein